MEFEEKPRHPQSDKASMGIYIFTWPVLREFLCVDERDPGSTHDFGKDVIPAMLCSGRRMCAYEFNDYWKDVGTVQSLWEANMDILEEHPPLELNDNDWRIYSKCPCMPPHWVSASSCVIRSAVTEGCSISGRVEHSVIFAGVTVEEGAEVLDSVLMPNARVLRGAKVIKAILGENAVIGEDAVIGAQKLPVDGDYDTSLTGDITMIASDTVIENGSRVPAGMIVNAGIYGEGEVQNAQ